MPSLGLLTSGRPDLSGPLSQLGLGRDGTFFVIAAGRANHAGAGDWQGNTTGNSSFIGIEAENTGHHERPAGRPLAGDPARCLSQGLRGDPEEDHGERDQCCGHKEYALPQGRKPD